MRFDAPLKLHQADVVAMLEIVESLATPNPSGGLLNHEAVRVGMMRLLRVDFVGLAQWCAPDDGQTQVTQCGRSAQLEQAYAQVRSEHSNLDEEMSVRARLHTGAALVSSLLPPKAFSRCDYFNVILKPFEIQDMVGMYLRRDGQVIGNISVARPKSGQLMGAREVALLNLLAPYLSKAACAQAVVAGLQVQKGLTTREAEVCQYLLKGLTDAEIAHHMGIKYWTVRTYMHSLFGKFDVSNRVELAVRLKERNSGV